MNKCGHRAIQLYVACQNSASERNVRKLGGVHALPLQPFTGTELWDRLVCMH